MTQPLILPTNIPWRRLAFSADMFDTSFGDLAFPPKWRSSLAVYYYAVPADESQDRYPEGRIVYLRLTCTITGYNPSEDLRDAVPLGDASNELDGLQRSTWEAIAADDWASTYWPCLGAIAQIAIYPRTRNEVPVAEYPYIVDFEPKKREMYETRSETGEFLSGSAESVEIEKGMSTTRRLEKSDISTGQSGSISAEYKGITASLGASRTGEWGTRQSREVGRTEVETSDRSQDQRESLSHTTTINQLYQLFNGSHLGTNRAVFSMSPRPHIVSDTEAAPYNLINGQRKLEGLQDMFLVVHMPASSGGLCVQASLDTGHRVEARELGFQVIPDEELPQKMFGRRRPLSGATDDLVDVRDHRGERIPVDLHQLVVTRRFVTGCATFEDSEDGRIEDVSRQAQPPAVSVVYEDVVRAPTMSTAALLAGGQPGRSARIEQANTMNQLSQRIASALVSGFSAGSYKPRSLVETDTFRRLAFSALGKRAMPLSALVELGYMDAKTAAGFESNDVHSVADLFSPKVDGSRAVDVSTLAKARHMVLAAVLDAPKRCKPSRDES